MKPDISRRRVVCVLAAMLFDYTLDFHTNDFRQYPELYRVGWGEQRTAGAALQGRNPAPLALQRRGGNYGVIDDDLRPVWGLFESS